MKKIFLCGLSLSLALSVVLPTTSVLANEIPENPINILDGSSKNQNAWQFNELYRNQFHYSAKRNWLNDPNGLLYDDSTGIYHMYYQYNPNGNGWGDMSWGHATSTDLINWKEEQLAIPMLTNQAKTEFLFTNQEGEFANQELKYWGQSTTDWNNETGKKYIFSGSTVLDKNNVAGFGTNAILAYYTSCYQIPTRKNDDGENGLGTWIGFQEVQEQHIAYSVDGGKTFIQYDGDLSTKDYIDPIIPVTVKNSAGNYVVKNAKDFRDPKVVYDEANGQWIMVTVAGQEALIFKSTNLKDWTYASTITRGESGGLGVWECPELIPMKVEGNETKWVLTMSIQDGSPGAGSGMQYMVGELDANAEWTPVTKVSNGKTTLEEPVCLDFGEDYYAGVTFGNTGDRKIMLAWMSNWVFQSEQKTSPWYSNMTVPRELKLEKIAGDYILKQMPIAELSNIYETSINLTTKDTVANQVVIDATGNEEKRARVTNYNGSTYKIEAEFSWDAINQDSFIGMNIRASEDGNKNIKIGYHIDRGVIYLNRLSTDEANIGGENGRDCTNASVATPDKNIKITALVDESSVEVFANDGEKTITQVFYFRPENIGNLSTDNIDFYAQNVKGTISNAQVTPLRSIFGSLIAESTTTTLVQGSNFSPFGNVKFYNIDGLGNKTALISNLSIKENNVDTMNLGEQTVVYGVTNNLGKYEEKTITYTVVAAEKAELQTLYDTNKNKQVGNYTADSWGTFLVALENAKQILANLNVNQTQIDDAKIQLELAIKGLKTASAPSEPSKPSVPTEPNDPVIPSNPSVPNETPKALILYRAYNPNSGEHLYTTSKYEYDITISEGWKAENNGWNAPSFGETVYRLYNPNSGEHFYTLSVYEYNAVAAAGWKKEGIAFYSHTDKEVPVYRLFNPNAKGAGSHHFTVNLAERNMLISLGWKNEGIAFYGMN